jgi:hypothetical protein
VIGATLFQAMTLNLMVTKHNSLNGDNMVWKTANHNLMALDRKQCRLV